MYDDLQHDDTENVNDNYLLKLYWNLIFEFEFEIWFIDVFCA